jgi:hypothetical protein
VAVSTESDANAYFLPALADGVRHYAVDSRASQGNRQHRHQADESSLRALEPLRIGGDVGHGLHLLDREIGIKVANFLTKGWSE